MDFAFDGISLGDMSRHCTMHWRATMRNMFDHVIFLWLCDLCLELGGASFFYNVVIMVVLLGDASPWHNTCWSALPPIGTHINDDFISG